MIDSHFPSPGKQSDNLKEIEEEILINEKKRKSVQTEKSYIGRTSHRHGQILQTAQLPGK